MIRITSYLVLALLCATSIVGFTGCNGAAPTDEHADDHNHDEGHDHAHESGPHGGHIVELGEENYHLEWLDDDEAKTVTFYLLDASGKEEVAIADEAITIKLIAGEGDREYQAKAVKEEGAETTAKFLNEEAEFFTMLMSDEVKANVTIAVDGETYSGEFEAGGHHHHHH